MVLSDLLSEIQDVTNTDKPQAKSSGQINLKIPDIDFIDFNLYPSKRCFPSG
jgi:hypothetical protein